MKEVLICGIMSLILLGFIACDSKDKPKDSPVENLEDLKEKYSDKEFANCDEFFAATEEMMTVYIDAIENAEVDDEDSKEKIDEISVFISEFEKPSLEFKRECPEKYNEMITRYSNDFEKYYDKINAIYGLDELAEEFEMIDEELKKALMEINEDEESDKRMLSGTE